MGVHKLKSLLANFCERYLFLNAMTIMHIFLFGFINGIWALDFISKQSHNTSDVCTRHMFRTAGVSFNVSQMID